MLRAHPLLHVAGGVVCVLRFVYLTGGVVGCLVAQNVPGESLVNKNFLLTEIWDILKFKAELGVNFTYTLALKVKIIGEVILHQLRVVIEMHTDVIVG